MTNRNAQVLLAGILSLVIGVGAARFAFTSLLPVMLEDGLSVDMAGFLAAINYVGYLSGAILSIFMRDWQLKVRLFRFGLLLCAVTTLILGVSRDPLLWSGARLFAGFGSAMALVVGGSLVMSLLSFENKTKAMGLYFSGIGFSILIPDLLVKAGLAAGLHWQTLWLSLTLMAALCCFLPWRVLVDTQPTAAKGKAFHFDRSLFTGFVLLLIIAYFTEGVGFVVQATFLPDIINQVIPGMGSQTWLLVGIAAIFSSILLMTVAHHIGNVNTIIIAMLLQIVGILIPALTDNAILNLLSGVIYGGTFAGLVALFMHLGGTLSKDNPVVLMGAITTAYGIGQISAPLYSVKLLTISGNYNSALWLTAAIVFSGALLMIISKKLDR